MNKKKKVIIWVICIAVAILVAADIIVSNYLVSFAIVRKTDWGRDIVPESTATAEDGQVVRENLEEAYLLTQGWYENSAKEEMNIVSEDGLNLKGMFFPLEGSHNYALVIHGYSSRKEDTYVYASRFSSLGMNVLCPDMRAHGESDGTYIGMGWLDRKDVLLWIDEIIKKDAGANIMLFGVSMGGATVLMTSGEDLPENVKVIVSDCAYKDVWSIFSDELEFIFHLPSFPLLNTASFVAKLRAGYSFAEASAINQVKKAKVPILFIHGSEDTFVKTYMCNELYEACPTKKDILIVDGADHGVSVYRDPEAYFTKVCEFLDSVGF